MGAVLVTVSALVLTVWLARRGRRVEAALVAGTILTLLPVAQLKPLETVLSERFLYLPSAVAASTGGRGTAGSSSPSRVASNMPLPHRTGATGTATGTKG